MICSKPWWFDIQHQILDDCIKKPYGGKRLYTLKTKTEFLGKAITIHWVKPFCLLQDVPYHKLIADYYEHGDLQLVGLLNELNDCTEGFNEQLTPLIMTVDTINDSLTDGDLGNIEQWYKALKDDLPDATHVLSTIDLPIAIGTKHKYVRGYKGKVLLRLDDKVMYEGFFRPPYMVSELELAFDLFSQAYDERNDR